MWSLIAMLAALVANVALAIYIARRARDVRRLAELAAMSHATVSPGWPPPFAAAKGVKQDLSMPGFAFTYGNGCAFVHMKPVLHFGPGADRKALEEFSLRTVRAFREAERVMVGVLDVPPAAAAAAAAAFEDDPGCDKRHPETGLPCIDDLGHDGSCSFIEAHSSAKGAPKQ